MTNDWIYLVLPCSWGLGTTGPRFLLSLPSRNRDSRNKRDEINEEKKSKEDEEGKKRLEFKGPQEEEEEEEEEEEDGKEEVLVNSSPVISYFFTTLSACSPLHAQPTWTR